MPIEKLQNWWLWTSCGDLRTELRQLREEGRDVRTIEKHIERLIALGDEKLFADSNQRKAEAVYDDAARLPMARGYSFVEPSDLPGIRQQRGPGPRRYRKILSPKQLYDRIHGAWLGRCAGCLLGKPIEGVRTTRLWPVLQRTRQWPLSAYMKLTLKGAVKKDFPDFDGRGWADDIDHMPIDDDTNYTTTGLLIVERHGSDFTPADVAQFWMSEIPALATCTAERIAYRNFMLQVQPPASAAYRNPYREWIGAQIRADGFGYVNVGNPQRAAEFAWRDASISHVKNGIYGEMLMAAMIAAAPFCDDIMGLIRTGLSEIPARSRLHADVEQAIGWYTSGLTYDQAVAEIHRKWDETTAHDWCHTNSNAVICVVGLLYGDGDFGKSICRAVQPCFDTDCNGATVGSILGMRLGAAQLPAQWTTKLHNTLHTSIQHNNILKLDELARRTAEVCRKIRE